MIGRVLVGALGLALAAGCSVAQEAAGPSLVGAWQVVEIAGKTTEDPARVTMEFDGQGKVGGRSSCNRYGSGYQISGEAISFSGGMMTRMACFGPAMGEESAFHEALGKVTRYAISADGTLRLLQGETVEILARRSGP